MPNELLQPDGHAHRRSVWPAIHGGLLLTGFIVVGCLPPLAWPWYLLGPLAGYTCFVLIVPPLRRTMPALKLGRVDKVGALAAMIITGICVGVLLGFQAIYRPSNVSSLGENLPALLFIFPALGGLCFSLINAVLEELMCRWVLYDAVAAEWGVLPALLATSTFFGLCHVNGYPPGTLGAVLAGLYGFALGLLRWRSGGLALAMGSHVCADVTIFCIICNAV